MGGEPRRAQRSGIQSPQESLIKHECPDGVPQQVQQVQGCSGRTQPDTGTGVISLNKANQASIHQLRLQQHLLFL